MATAYRYWGGSGHGGNWINVTNQYLGLKFEINGKTHYGWARLSVQAVYYTITATLTGYAYETIPNKPIIAGRTKGPDEISSIEQPTSAPFISATLEPAGLGLLAMGAPGLSIWRREDSVGATVSSS